MRLPGVVACGGFRFGAGDGGAAGGVVFLLGAQGFLRGRIGRVLPGVVVLRSALAGIVPQVPPVVGLGEEVERAVADMGEALLARRRQVRVRREAVGVARAGRPGQILGRRVPGQHREQLVEPLGARGGGMVLLPPPGRAGRGARGAAARRACARWRRARRAR
ncbi:hypothetical protein [Pelagerythrobacter aerophilus]|uniref:Uncharacterized protein n=1 Tax=Pelagerythrobacter aerophilus TaxID=2306995 RepID=A0A418NMJ1_9SPHN|nr:hypothetical protein [Pelagerythrobacter aerophilus]RIV81243.1 hypothetical protein D2V04_01125 [Pelagerythrobacter aerophilus]